MMEPTIGRIVHLHLNGCTSPSPAPVTNSPDVPFQATIVYVWGPSLVNLAYHDHNGNPGRLTSVAILNPGDEYPPCGGGAPYATWMPYQVAKAGAGDHNSESAEPRPMTIPNPAQGETVDLDVVDDVGEPQPAEAFNPSPCGEPDNVPATEPAEPPACAQP